MRILKTLIKLIITMDPVVRFEQLHRIGKILVPTYRFK